MQRFLKGITIAASLAATSSAFSGVITFESGFTDQQFVSSVNTGDNVVQFGLYNHNSNNRVNNGAYIAQAGGLQTAYVPGDRIPAGHNGGSFFLTDERHGPSKTLDYAFGFRNGITSLSMDLYDYRPDGGPIPGDTATLTVYDAVNNVVATQTHTIPHGTNDPNLFSFDLSFNKQGYSAAMRFSRRDIGTGIDNIRFTTGGNGPGPGGPVNVPNPGTLLLIGLGLMGVVSRRHKVKQQ